MERHIDLFTIIMLRSKPESRGQSNRLTPFSSFSKKNMLYTLYAKAASVLL